MIKNLILIFTCFYSLLSFSQEDKASIYIEGKTLKRVEKYTKNFKVKKKYATQPLGNVKAKITENNQIIAKSNADSLGNYSLNFYVDPNKNYYLYFTKNGYYPKIFKFNTNGISARKEIVFKGWEFHLYKRVIGLKDSVFLLPTKFYYDSERGYMTYDEVFNTHLEVEQEKVYIDFLSHLNNNKNIVDELNSEPQPKKEIKNKDTLLDYIISEQKNVPDIQLIDMAKLLNELKLSKYEDTAVIENKEKEVYIERKQLEYAQKRAVTNEDKLKIVKAHQLLNEKEEQIELAKNEIVKAKKIIELQQLENQTKNYLLVLSFSLITLFLILLFVLIKNNKERKRINLLLEEKNKEVIDSIKYAQRIQNAILPPQSIISKNLKQNFILFKPKDIVSGDFYWIENINNCTFFAVVDCTGHGVPGAFMSIIAFNALNQAVNEYKLRKPADILNQVNIEISKTLHQTENIDVEDGMDISLCMLNTDTKELEFAGAHHTLNIVSNGELTTIKSDKFSIGSQKGKDKKFQNHCFKLKKDDFIYIFSDGYADQFGGAKERKFMYKNLRSLLLKNHKKDILLQKQILNDEFYAWKGNLEQVDDICIMGIKIE